MESSNINFQAAANTQAVGRAIGYMFNELKKSGFKSNQFECFGHSLANEAQNHILFYIFEKQNIKLIYYLNFRAFNRVSCLFLCCEIY